MFIVKTSSAKMPRSVKSQYRKVALIELEEGFTDCAMISTRARGVKRIVREWGPCHVGKTKKSAYQIALGEAQLMCDMMQVS